MNKFDCIIIGSGVTGASIFYYLTLLGRNPLLIEKSTMASGATGKSGAFLRTLHSTQYLSQLAVKNFHELYDFLVKYKLESCFCSAIFTIIASASNASKFVSEANRLRREFNRVEIIYNYKKKMLPFFDSINLDEKEIMICDYFSGYIDPKKLVFHLINAGCNNGGEYLDNTEVKEILINENKCVSGVATNRIDFYSKCVVVAAGSGSNNLLKNFKCDLTRIYSKVIPVDYFDIDMCGDGNFTLPFIDYANKFYGAVNHQGLMLGQFDSIIDENYFSYDHKNHVLSLDKFSKRFLTSNNFKWLDYELSSEAYTDFSFAYNNFLDGICGVFVSAGWSGVGFKFSLISGKKSASLIDLYIRGI